ncbi:MAG: DNA replication/repair protein RecF [Acutalibacteraceae bacterium]|nr:DNA replication/repair protein RecF [Acutalibacteraceae bacterium]
MYIQQVTFENYRNLQPITFLPEKGINVIYGDNAQGKTNLLEGIWLFTGGRSFRGAKDNELIAFHQNYARLQLSFRSREREQTIVININNHKRSAFLNGVPKSSMAQIIGHFCAVVFSPHHLSLIKSGPEERRNFIDAAICQIKPLYVASLSRYKRILNERNALLKDIPQHRELEDMLSIWNERLAAEGAVIVMERRRYIRRLSESAVRFYDGLSGGKELMQFTYKTTAAEPQEESDIEKIRHRLLTALQNRQNDDIYCGYTTVGVHRDDLIVRIDGKEARSFGSQGQQRSAVLAMKLAEAALLGEAKGEKPVILLDDVLSELDPKRQQYLLTRLEDFQVLITCCEKEITAAHPVHISGGQITTAEE